jgi:hypothetical protein
VVRSVPTGGGQVGDESIDRADLNTNGAQRVAPARGGDVVIARGRQVLQHSEHLHDQRLGSLWDDALEQFLQDHPGRSNDHTTGERISQRPDLRDFRRSASAQRERPDLRIDEQAHPRESSAL